MNFQFKMTYVSGRIQVEKDILFSRLACEQRPEYKYLLDVLTPSYKLDKILVENHPILAKLASDIEIKDSTILTVNVRKTEPVFLEVVIKLDLGAGLLLFYKAEFNNNTAMIYNIDREEAEQTVDWYQAVYNFTKLVNDNKLESDITPMSRDTVIFLTRMVISELDELLATVQHGSESRTEILYNCVNNRDYTRDVHYESYLEQAGYQADALVDYIYYTLNCASKSNLELNKLFQTVHQANMAKRDPTTFKFIKRESDGKIMKPMGWQSPDICQLIKYLAESRGQVNP